MISVVLVDNKLLILPIDCLSYAPNSFHSYLTNIDKSKLKAELNHTHG